MSGNGPDHVKEELLTPNEPPDLEPENLEMAVGGLVPKEEPVDEAQPEPAPVRAQPMNAENNGGHHPLLVAVDALVRRADAEAALFREQLALWLAFIQQGPPPQMAPLPMPMALAPTVALALAPTTLMPPAPTTLMPPVPSASMAPPSTTSMIPSITVGPSAQLSAGSSASNTQPSASLVTPKAKRIRKKGTPKPVKWKCPFCPKSTAHDSAQCNGCFQWVHTRCAGLKSHRDIPAGFMCPNCHP